MEEKRKKILKIVNYFANYLTQAK